MTDTSRLARRVAGSCSLAAAGVALLSSFQTWLEGGSFCGESVTLFIRADLWQVAGPWRPPWFSLALWLVVGGAAVLAFVGVNELGLPMLRWLDPLRWAPALVGMALIAVGASLVHAPTPAGNCYSSITTGPGKWIALIGAAIGAVATMAIVIAMRSRRDEDDSLATESEGLEDVLA